MIAGGLKGTRGWDRRWFVFCDGALKYFRTESDEKEKPSVIRPQGLILDDEGYYFDPRNDCRPTLSL